MAPQTIWIVNPFDELPNSTDVPLRYWSLCKTLTKQGHEVIWWSSDFSHLTKSKRTPCPPTDRFTVRLIATQPYTSNISFARLKNHKRFAQGFHDEALDGLKSGKLKAPDRIVVSLPPLGVAEQAFKIRESIKHQNGCKVIVDIMDAWPETFYQLIPQPFRNTLAPLLLTSLRRSARNAYIHSDGISGVGQSYLDLAKSYGAICPTHLCYHGADLNRFNKPENLPRETNTRKKAVYLGAMGHGYDLQTIIEVAKKWKTEDRFPWEIHLAGDGPQRKALEDLSAELTPDNRLVFHGYLKKEAITDLLLNADLALVPNRPGSLVACPYKAGEYAAAGLPMISCLGGELKQVLNTWNAGTEYKEGDVDSLDTAFGKYSADFTLLKQQSLRAREMAEALFDRERTYADWADFILG